MNSITSVGEILFDIYPDKKIPGGAPFNFIYHINKVSGDGSFISKVGEDENGNEILSFVRENGISTDLIQTDNSYTTGAALASLDDNKVPNWTIKENCAYDFIEYTKETESHIIHKTDCVYFGTLAQRGDVSSKTISKILMMNKKYFCDLNIRQKYYSPEIIRRSLKAANVLKINLEELLLINELLYNIYPDESEIVKRIQNDFIIEMIAVTNGAEGATLYTGEHQNKSNIKVSNVIDTVGAGDAYTAVLCLGYLNKLDPEKTNETASGFAAYIITQRGALPASDDIYDILKETLYDDS